MRVSARSLGVGVGGGRADEEKGPWDFVVSVRKVVDEVEHDCRDDEGREELAESDEVEGEYGVVRRLLLDFASRHPVDISREIGCWTKSPICCLCDAF